MLLIILLTLQKRINAVVFVVLLPPYPPIA